MTESVLILKIHGRHNSYSESRDIYNEAKSTDCFFEQFEYTGPRVTFDVVDDPAELTEAVNDSLTLVTVSQAEYTVPYEDIEVYVR